MSSRCQSSKLPGPVPGALQRKPSMYMRTPLDGHLCTRGQRRDIEKDLSMRICHSGVFLSVCLKLPICKVRGQQALKRYTWCLKMKNRGRSNRPHATEACLYKVPVVSAMSGPLLHAACNCPDVLASRGTREESIKLARCHPPGISTYTSLKCCRLF